MRSAFNVPLIGGIRNAGSPANNMQPQAAGMMLTMTAGPLIVDVLADATCAISMGMSITPTPVQINPVMTSNSSGGYTAVSNGGSPEAYKPFNFLTANFTPTNDPISGTFEVWLQLELPHALSLYSVDARADLYLGASPVTNQFINKSIYGSNDGITFTTIATENSQNQNPFIAFGDGNPYKIFRLRYYDGTLNPVFGYVFHFNQILLTTPSQLAI